MTTNNRTDEEKNYTDQVPDDFDFNHYCWILASTRDQFFPWKETAEKSMEGMDIETSEERAEEIGYFRGGWTMTDEAISSLEMYDIDVEGRAKLYAEENGLEPPLTHDEMERQYKEIKDVE